MIKHRLRQEHGVSNSPEFIAQGTVQKLMALEEHNWISSVELRGSQSRYQTQNDESKLLLENVGLKFL